MQAYQQENRKTMQLMLGCEEYSASLLAFPEATKMFAAAKGMKKVVSKHIYLATRDQRGVEESKVVKAADGRVSSGRQSLSLRGGEDGQKAGCEQNSRMW